MMKRLCGAFYVIALFSLISCKKSDDDGPSSNNNPNAAIDDSALLYAQDIYLWNTQIPSSFSADSYSDPNEVMEGIRQFSIETGFPDPVDHYSFGITQSEWNNVSTGVEEDFGMSVFFNTPTDLRVKYAEQASPSGLAGIRRGWQIVKINGNSDIDTSAASIDWIVNEVFYSSSTTFTFKKPDGIETEITLNAATYQSHPIFADSVYTVNNKKVGYFVLNSFFGRYR